MLDEKTRALLGDAEAAKSLTEKGILLKCPVCGGEAAVSHGEVLTNGAKKYEADFFVRWEVECSKCHFSKGSFPTFYKISGNGNFERGEFDGLRMAIKNWNSRAQILTTTQIAKLDE